MAAHAADSGAPNESIEALRRLKATESDAETKVKQLAAEGAAQSKRLREAAESAVVAAKTEAERAADLAIAGARADLAGELTKVVRAGEAEAADLAAHSKSELAALRSKILDVVMEGFRTD